MGGTYDPLAQHIRFHIAGMKERETGKLPDCIKMAIGMKAMILFNLSTKAEIANGRRGTIRDIILDPREENPQLNDESGLCTM
jgi:hypothetical protein